MEKRSTEETLPGLKLYFVRPGENGSCPKQVGSNGCSNSITKCACKGIIQSISIAEQDYATEIACDSAYQGGGPLISAKLRERVLYHRSK